MKSILNTNYLKSIKLICLVILFCLTFHQIKTLSKTIKINSKKLLKIQNYNLKIKNTINQSLKPKNLINSISTLINSTFTLKTTKTAIHYIYKTKITTELINTLINLLNNYNNSHTELTINKINNTIELIIPKSK
tara:strand:+ start:314 stop:718 length:405 start_codon:yes stop_codon:yes gene_type:complete